jgi:hypothetical protein
VHDGQALWSGFEPDDSESCRADRPTAEVQDFSVAWIILRMPYSSGIHILKGGQRGNNQRLNVIHTFDTSGGRDVRPTLSRGATYVTTTQRMMHPPEDFARSYSSVRTLHNPDVETYHRGGIIKRSPGDWTWV